MSFLLDHRCRTSGGKPASAQSHAHSPNGATALRWQSAQPATPAMGSAYHGTSAEPRPVSEAERALPKPTMGLPACRSHDAEASARGQASASRKRSHGELEQQLLDVICKTDTSAYELNAQIATLCRSGADPNKELVVSPELCAQRGLQLSAAPSVLPLHLAALVRLCGELNPCTLSHTSQRPRTMAHAHESRTSALIVCWWFDVQ